MSLLFDAVRPSGIPGGVGVRRCQSRFLDHVRHPVSSSGWPCRSPRPAAQRRAQGEARARDRVGVAGTAGRGGCLDGGGHRFLLRWAWQRSAFKPTPVRPPDSTVKGTPSGSPWAPRKYGIRP